MLIADWEGDTMIKGTPELITERREEIINACEKLYQAKSFKEITLKEIGNEVPFSRPTIYNYFQTKEEIFLALFQREYDRWNEDLTAILKGSEHLTKAELAEKIAVSLAGRKQLLKLLSMNNYDMEANSRQELLTAFKKSYGRSMHLVCMLLTKFCPDMSVSEIQNFIYTFYPFMFGIYPYTAVTEKQKTAMKEAGINYVYQTVYELTYGCLIRLLGE
jgi:AcrR family transcriptional regulator